MSGPLRWLVSCLTRGSGRAPAPRFRPKKQHPVEVQILGQNSIDVLRARDISATGMGIFVPHRFEGCDIDAAVELVVTFPRQRPFVTRGCVRHATETGHESPFYGVHFTALAPEHARAIANYLAGDFVEPVKRGDTGE